MDEDRSVSELSVRDGQAVHSTINSRGWTEVIKPALENRMVALVNDFANATSYKEFVQVQQAINAIKGLMSFIEVKLIEGRTALEDLKKEV